jgi:DNA-binding PucR family transcriptional regulator
LCECTIWRTLLDVSIAPTVVHQIREIAARQLRAADERADAITAAILESAPILSEDASLSAEMYVSTRANVRRFLSLQVAYPGQPPPPDIPPEALDLARSMVRRGVDLGVLSNSYRRGQNVAWQQWMTTALDVAPTEELPELLSASSTLVFSFVDTVLSALIAQIEREREELLGGALARRERTLRLLLDGAPLEQHSASATLGYELGRMHTAFIVWGEPGHVTESELEKAATAIALAAGVVRPLRFSASASALWGWLGSDAELNVAPLRAAAEMLTGTARAVIGASRRGTTGFRQSHDDAIATQRLLLSKPHGDRFTAYRDVEVITLLAGDQQRLHEFIAEALGPLAAPSATAARLRETLRIYLQEADNAAATAVRLNTHRNTVLYRVARARELLGQPLAPRRLAMSVALEAVHRLGITT